MKHCSHQPIAISNACAAGNRDDDIANPLDELTPEQRRALLQFVKEQEKRARPWKIKLLNDWLHNCDSRAVQFIHNNHGPQWLNSVKPKHLAQYFEAETSLDDLKLREGDRTIAESDEKSAIAFL